MNESEYNAEVRQTPEMLELTIPVEESLKLAEECEDEDDQG